MTVTAPRVSLITPTGRRERFLRLQHATLQQQRRDDFEWLILDDSPAPSRFFADNPDARVRYRHTGDRLSIGAKRNALVEAASGEFIVHLDDDDYYGPGYVQRMVQWLEEGADLVKLQDFFVYSSLYGKLGYWQLGKREGIAQVWSAKPVQYARVTPPPPERLALEPWGFGFSYAYRRQLAVEHPFPDRDWGEDSEFIAPLLQPYDCRAERDQRGLCLHIMHGGNSSVCYPQYELPPFALTHFFPEVPESLLAAGPAQAAPTDRTDRTNKANK